jgi:hypothetical protein
LIHNPAQRPCSLERIITSPDQVLKIETAKETLFNRFRVLFARGGARVDSRVEFCIMMMEW